MCSLSELYVGEDEVCWVCVTRRMWMLRIGIYLGCFLPGGNSAHNTIVTLGVRCGGRERPFPRNTSRMHRDPMCISVARCARAHSRAHVRMKKCSGVHVHV